MSLVARQSHDFDVHQPTIKAQSQENRACKGVS